MPCASTASTLGRSTPARASTAATARDDRVDVASAPEDAAKKRASVAGVAGIDASIATPDGDLSSERTPRGDLSSERMPEVEPEGVVAKGSRRRAWVMVGDRTKGARR